MIDSILLFLLCAFYLSYLIYDISSFSRIPVILWDEKKQKDVLTFVSVKKKYRNQLIKKVDYSVDLEVK